LRQLSLSPPSMMGAFYNPAVDGRKVPGLDERAIVHRAFLLRVDEPNEAQARETERRTEVGRHYAERSHRFLAELLRDLSLWAPLAPLTYIPKKP
jgi:hypothetical protein